MSELKVKFVQISNDKVNIRGVTEPIEDGDDPVHGFIENKLYAVFGGDLSPSEQFQNHKLQQKSFQPLLSLVTSSEMLSIIVTVQVPSSSLFLLTSK